MNLRRRSLAAHLVLVLAAALLVTVGAAPATAHNGPYDMKFVDGSRLILLTFNTHSPTSEMEILHNIRLYDFVGTPIPYADVHVTVAQRGLAPRLTLRGEDLADITAPMRATNDSSFALTYPQQGQYTLVTTFHRPGGTQLARGEFALDVAKGVGGTGLPLATAGLTMLAFALGALVTYAALRRRGVSPGAPTQPVADVLAGQ